MASDISVKIDHKQLNMMIKGLGKRTKDLRPALKRCAVYMISSFDKNFKAGGRPTKWRKLALNTIAKRRKASNLPLMDKGMMRLSSLATTGKGSIYQLRRDSLIMGTAVAYGKWQQWGTNPYIIRPIGGGLLAFPVHDGFLTIRQVNHPGLPERPFIMFQSEDVREVEKIIVDYIGG